MNWKYSKSISMTLIFMMVFSLLITISYGEDLNQSVDLAQNDGPQNIEEVNMSDISNHWGYEAISKWVDKNLISGYPDGTFKPDGKITRAELLTLINRLYGFYETSDKNYSDVAEDDWYYDEVSIAKKNMYLDWYKEKAFYPNKKITRQEACAILSAINNLDLLQESASMQAYSDYASIPEWSREYIDAVVSKGYIKGYEDKTLRPEGEITRAEAVTMLDRVIGKLINKEGTYGPEEGQQIIESNLTINSKDVILQNTIVKGDLILAAGVKEGNVDLQNVIVEGKTIINGGGENSITFDSSVLGEIIVFKVNGMIRVVSKDSEIGRSILKSGGKLEGQFNDSKIEILGDGQKIELDGDFDEIKVEAEITIEVTNDTTVNVLEIAKNGNGTQIDIEKNAQVREIIFNESAIVTGKGNVIIAKINADEVTMEQQVEQKIVQSGVDGSGVKEKTKSTGSFGGTSRDNTAPTPGNNGNIDIECRTQSAILSWVEATDNKTDQNELEYLVYYSENDNIDTVSDIELNGDAIGTYEADIRTKSAIGLTSDTTYYFNVIVKDESGNKSSYESIYAKTDALEDMTTPTVNTYFPVADANDIAADSDLALEFNETVVKGIGNITVKKSDNTTVETINVTSSAVTINSDEVTINLSSNLEYGTGYYIYIDAGAFLDLSGNQYAGIDDATVWNFTIETAPDTGPPTVNTYFPADNANDIATDSDLVVEFNETVVKGIGNITVKKSDNTTVETINVTSSAVTINSDEVTINLSSNLEYGTGYYILLNAGAFLDLSGNTYAGIDDSVTWNFTVVSSKEMTGEGTSDNPFIINSIEDLVLVGSGVNSDGNDYSFSAYYELGRDLDFEATGSYESETVNTSLTKAGGGSGFTPIGSNSDAFNGSFDGKGYVISNLYMNTYKSGEVNYAALFGYVINGQIKNLGIVDADITASAYNHNPISSILAGANIGGTITNCYVTGNSNAVRTGTSGSSYASGLIGSNDGSITNCYAEVDVESSAGTYTAYAGGLVAASGGGSVISDCYSMGDVTVSGGSVDGGGIAAYNHGTITRCYSTCDISATGTGGLRVGGIVGYNGSNSITSSIAYNNTLTTSTTGTSYIGRVVGNNTATLSNNYAKENMIGGGGTATHDDTGGADISMTQLNEISSYDNTGTAPDLNWDFDTIWQMGLDRPIIRGVGDDNGGLPFNYLINDDFEDDTAGSAPSDWTIKYTPVTVSNTISKNGSHSLSLDGVNGSAAACYKPIDISGLNTLIFEAFLYPTSEQENGTMEFSNNYENRKLRVTVLNGKIQYSTSAHDNNNLVELADYTVNTWYHVKIVTDLVAKTFDVYTDGIKRNNDPISLINMLTPLNAAGMSSGNSGGSNLIYFDDVKVYGY